MIAYIISLSAIFGLWFYTDKRKEAVFKYRLNVLVRNKELYKKLPRFYKMVLSTKPLEDKYWTNL